jgi:glycosyltransferase involved in cell wall biosynthesis
MLRVLYVLHGYPPYHNAGAETMAHQVCRWLTARGHHVQVLARGVVAGPVFEGVRVKPRGPIRWLERELGPRTVVLTHLDETPLVEATARKAGAPLVHVLHNDRQLEFHGVTYAGLIVANTAWVAEAIPERLASVPRIVVHPPTFASEYPSEGPGRDSVTLVNLTEGKGAPLFYDLARRLPHRRFLAVTGAYGVQLKAPELPNLTVRPNRPDMAAVWAQTRVLVAPSSYESYGKAAVEALASAVPVIAHPTPGLVESLGPAGIFADRDDVDAWVDALDALDDPETYALAAKAARARAEELEAVTIAQLEALEGWLEKLAGT